MPDMTLDFQNCPVFSNSTGKF